MRKNNQYYFRKVHRWLGVIIGIQFLGWTISGLYFTWTDLDDIHGDHFLVKKDKPTVSGLSPIDSTLQITDLELRFVDDTPYYWVNDSLLIQAKTSIPRGQINREEVRSIVQNHVRNDYKISDIKYLTKVSNHHEYRNKPLPVWVVTFEGEEHLTAYVSALDGSFQSVRHSSWRWFDFLWMFHTMDYESRDNFNNLLIRGFSLFGLLTVLSGFTLFIVTTKRKKSINSHNKSNKT